MSAYFQQDKTSLYLDQSVRDSPCRVRFAGEESLISLSKWGGEASLTFGAGNEHSGHLEICRNEIFLKPASTRMTHHVFRKLDGERFEYDVILLKEPEKNVIEIDLEFPDGLEFFRQPSLEEVLARKAWCPPEVIDSYAVYWKNRNGLYKTGKFCHIYRPLIYDARGRKVWGRLLLNGKKLTITIPEEWLAEAAYPVVVDPVLGTQIRGAVCSYDRYHDGNIVDFSLNRQASVNRFQARSEIAGTCTSYIYSFVNMNSLQGQAVMFSESDSFFPEIRLSRNEENVSLSRVTPAWVPSTFTLSRNISNGEAIFYGYNTATSLYTYIDFANHLETMTTNGIIPDPFIPVPIPPNQSFERVQMSMYFTYTDIQHFARTILDTIGLTETLAKQFVFKRVCSDAAGVFETPVTHRGFSRKCFSPAGVSDHLSLIQKLCRLCNSFLTVEERILYLHALFRRCVSGLSAIMTISRSHGQTRLVSSFCGFIERTFGRMLLKKEELIFVSRITREIEFKGYLL